jgi:hypothetical protein
MLRCLVRHFVVHCLLRSWTRFLPLRFGDKRRKVLKTFRKIRFPRPRPALASVRTAAGSARCFPFAAILVVARAHCRKCLTQIEDAYAQFLCYQPTEPEGSSKDYEFSRSSIGANHGEACNTACASAIPCRHRFSIGQCTTGFRRRNASAIKRAATLQDQADPFVIGCRACRKPVRHLRHVWLQFSRTVGDTSDQTTSVNRDRAKVRAYRAGFRRLAPFAQAYCRE